MKDDNVNHFTLHFEVSKLVMNEVNGSAVAGSGILSWLGD